MNEKIVDIFKTHLPGSFTQWIVNKVDHNPSTLEGKGSLSAWESFLQQQLKDAEEVETSFPIPAVPRKKCRKVTDATKVKSMPIMHYVSREENVLDCLKY